VTDDGIEEAMMMLGIESRGSAIPEIVYIFGLKNGRPIPLWSFETGDRADGGLRQVYADHGNLIVELFGKDRIIGKELYRGDEALCCPTTFTRARHEWRGSKFRLKEARKCCRIHLATPVRSCPLISDRLINDDAT
jgi:hypothetical protein